MPRIVRLDRLPAGFAATAMLPGQPGHLQVSGFHTSDEGGHFTKLLEGCEDYLDDSSVVRSHVDHLLAVVAPDRTATVYLNELTITAKTQVTRRMNAGEPVMLDDIADIIALDLGVPIAPDCGVFFMFSWRWRRGLFFDYSPLGPQRVPRNYDLATTLAACHCSLVFAERFSLTDDEWDKMIGAGWFPFVGLKNAIIGEMILHCKQGWDPARLQDKIVSASKEVACAFAESCKANPLFGPHAGAMAAAIRHFIAGDCLSAAHLLYPRIEGILRGYYHTVGAIKSPRQEDFLRAAAEGAMSGRHGYCLLLLDRFDAYLRKVVFVPFDPINPTGVSRHTVAHGLTNECDEKSVALALLCLHHLFYSLRSLHGEV